MSEVNEYKTKEADKFEIGMAKNNAAVLLSNSNLAGKEMVDVWALLVEELYEKGKEIRKKHLGY